jgi:hypothetical protein
MRPENKRGASNFHWSILRHFDWLVQMFSPRDKEGPSPSSGGKPFTREEFLKVIKVIEELKVEGKTLRNKEYKNLCLFIKEEAKKHYERRIAEDRIYKMTGDQMVQMRAQQYALLHINSEFPIPQSLLYALRGYNVVPTTWAITSVIAPGWRPTCSRPTPSV